MLIANDSGQIHLLDWIVGHYVDQCRTMLSSCWITNNFILFRYIKNIHHFVSGTTDRCVKVHHKILLQRQATIWFDRDTALNGTFSVNFLAEIKREEIQSNDWVQFLKFLGNWFFTSLPIKMPIYVYRCNDNFNDKKLLTLDEGSCMLLMYAPLNELHTIFVKHFCWKNFRRDSREMQPSYMRYRFIRIQTFQKWTEFRHQFKHHSYRYRSDSWNIFVTANESSQWLISL